MRNKQREEEIEKERAEVNRIIEFYKQQEKQEKLDHQERVKRYGDDLLQQMEYTSLQKKIVRFSIKLNRFLLSYRFLFI